jgi:hypothetical protein
MKEVIDLYAKMVIGTFSFIGPSFSLLIPIFYSAIIKSRERHELKIKNLQKAIQANISESKNFAAQIKVSSHLFDKMVRDNERELNLLNPKRQVKRLFRSLLISILFIGLYYFQHSHFWPYDFIAIKVACLTFSVLSFAFCLRVLWQIFCTIIEIKSEEQTIKSPKRTYLKRQ